MSNTDLARQLQDGGRPQLWLGGPEDRYWTGLLEEALTACGFSPNESWADDMAEMLADAIEGEGESFLNSTHRAVKAFQDFYGLVKDGVVGDATWGTLIWVLTGGENVDAAMTEPQPGEAEFPADGVLHRQVELSRDEIEFEQWLRSYGTYRNGYVSPWASEVDLELYRWADGEPEILGALEALLARDQGEHLVIWVDGRIETDADHEARVYRERLLRGLKVLTSSPFGAIGYGTAKAAGADEDAALSAGEFAHTLGDLAGGHQDAAGFEHPGSVADETLSY